MKIDIYFVYFVRGFNQSLYLLICIYIEDLSTHPLIIIFLMFLHWGGSELLVQMFVDYVYVYNFMVKFHKIILLIFTHL